jgi:hypothetical protein
MKQDSGAFRSAKTTRVAAKYAASTRNTIHIAPMTAIPSDRSINLEFFMMIIPPRRQWLFLLEKQEFADGQDLYP